MVCCLPLTHVLTHRQHIAALYTQHSVAMQFQILRYYSVIRLKNKNSLILTIKYTLLILYFAYSIFLSLEGCFFYTFFCHAFYFIAFLDFHHLFCFFAFVNLKLII